MGRVQEDDRQQSGKYRARQEKWEGKGKGEEKRTRAWPNQGLE